MTWRCRFLDGASAARSREIHPTHWLISTQVKTMNVRSRNQLYAPVQAARFLSLSRWRQEDIRPKRRMAAARTSGNIVDPNNLLKKL